MSDLINNGIIVLNKEKATDGNPTVIVLGVARSGTTMAANVLENLGVFMGGKKMSVVKEDRQIFTMLEKRGQDKEFAKLVEARNSKHEYWGWKRPKAIDYLEKFVGTVRNPHLVILFRDSLAISIRNQIAVKADVLGNLKDTHKRYGKLIEFVSNTDLPCLLISYEKAVQKRGLFVQSLAEYVGINASQQQLDAAKASIALDRKQYMEAAKLHSPTEGSVTKTVTQKRVGIGRNLINREKGIIMGFSPKSGCTLANKMFFESAGCLEEALASDPWIHRFRPIYNSKHPVTVKDLQQGDLYKFKIVRNPFKRVVSSYSHAMFTKYAEDDIKEVLKVKNPNNISFLQFLDYLENIDLTHTNPHHELQKLIKFGEGTRFKYDYICKLETIADGIEEINKKSKAGFILEKRISDSPHHVAKIAEFGGDAFDKPFNEIALKKDGRKVPDFKFFYNKEIVDRVTKLYQEDISEYGYTYDLED